MSNPPSVTSKAAVSSTKSSSSAAQVSPAASATQQYFSNDGGARRSGSSGGISSSKNSTPRNIQTSKPKHKTGKRFKALDEDADAEMYSMQNPNGRRGQQSITHLMQFSLPPRPHHNHGRSGHGSNRAVRRTWGLGSGYHAVDKARYIHANYRFIVDPRGDYKAQSEDAEVHLDWSSVLQIIASSKTQSASCPICLGEPTAPRMAKCGHMFCLPCLIRYMHSEDENQSGPEKKARWKKCPICEDSIYISETRPVRMYTGQEWDRPSEGADVVLRLVRRKPGETLAMPRESADPIAKGEHIPWYFAAEVMDYARVMKGSEEYMLSQYDEAISTIEQLEKEDELMFGEDTQWTRRAVRMLNEQKDRVKGIGNPPLQPKKPEQDAKPARPPIQFNDDESNVPQMYLQKQSETPLLHAVAENTLSEDATANENQSQNQSTSGPYIPRTIHEMRQRQFEKPQPNEYLFYHALQHYYLSPLDIRILRSAFGSYNNFPSSILPRVERVSSGHIVDDELKKRVKYLSHLPHGCEVGFLECDWTDTVNSEVLKEFKPMTERRRRRNEEKEAREEKDRVRIEKQAEREYAAVRRKRPSIPDDLFSNESLPGLGVDPSVVNIEDQAVEDGALGATPPWQNRRSTSGFASLASPSTSPTASRTVWGTTAVAPSSPDFHAALPKDSELHDDGWLQGWEKDLLEEQTLAAQAESMTLESGEKQAASRGKKGKKGKKITLMSTTARRHA